MTWGPGEDGPLGGYVDKARRIAAWLGFDFSLPAFTSFRRTNTQMASLIVARNSVPAFRGFVCRTWVRPMSVACTRLAASALVPRLPKKQEVPDSSSSFPFAPRPFTPTNPSISSVLLKLFSSGFPSRFSSTHRLLQLTSRQFSTMAPVKEYALLCLENPLLGTQWRPFRRNAHPIPQS